MARRHRHVPYWIMVGACIVTTAVLLVPRALEVLGV